jgi:uncharacterized membrane protein required for colicin V production
MRWRANFAILLLAIVAAFAVANAFLRPPGAECIKYVQKPTWAFGTRPYCVEWSK